MPNKDRRTSENATIEIAKKFEKGKLVENYLMVKYEFGAPKTGR